MPEKTNPPRKCRWGGDKVIVQSGGMEKTFYIPELNEENRRWLENIIHMFSEWAAENNE